MDDQTEACVSRPNNSCCAWPTYSRRSGITADLAAATSLPAIIGLQTPLQPSPPPSAQLRSAGYSDGLSYATGALATSGVRGLSARRQRIRCGSRRREQACEGGNDHDHDVEEDEQLADCVPERETIDLIQIPALLSANPTSNTIATTSIAGVVVADPRQPRRCWPMDREMKQVDHSCNRIRPDHSGLCVRQQTTTTTTTATSTATNLAPTTKPGLGQWLDSYDDEEPCSNRHRITRDINRCSSVTAISLAGAPVNHRNNQLDVDAGTTDVPSKIRRHAGQHQRPSGPVFSHNIIKAGNHKYCYGLRGRLTPRAWAATVFLFLSHVISRTCVWADQGLGE